MYKKWFAVVLVIMALVLLVSGVSALAAPSKSTVHIVQRGDTLASIARHYGVDMWTLARANGISNPNRIYVGQRLLIPTSQTGGSVHIVQPGETLYSIARRYNKNIWDIARANGIINLNHIYVGQRLIIPSAAPAPAPSPTRAPQPARPITWPGPWTGEYFDNISLFGSAYTTRTDEQINFDWGYGPPAGGMPTNAFSVRWTGTFNMVEGTYHFYARVDDGVRVYVDDLCIINGWRDGGLRLYQASQTLAAGEHTLRVEYYDRIQVSRIHFWWVAPSAPAPSPAPTKAPSATPAPGVGWYGQFYNNMELQDPPVATRYDPWIGFEWGTEAPLPGMRNDFFSVRWTTTAYLEADTYNFCAMSDDGVRIWVDDDRVLDEWHPNNGISYCGRKTVTAGNHPIKVEYYEEGGNALIYVWWEPR